MTVDVLGYLFAVAAAVCWASLDAARKRAADLGAIVVVAWFTLFQAPAFLVWMALEAAPFDVGYWGPGSAALVLNVMANVLFLRAVEVSPLSRTVPFLALGPVFTTLAGVPFLHEMPSSGQLVGIGLVVMGALLVNADRGSARSLGAMIDALRTERGSVLMIAVAFLWSLALIADKLALNYASKATHALVQTGGVGGLLVAYMVVRRRTAELTGARHRFPILLAAAGAATLATAFQLMALERLLAALVETLKRAVGLLSALVVGRLAFRESISRAQIVSIVILIAGTVLLVRG